METSLKLALPNFSLAAPKNLNCPKFGGGRLQPLSPPPRPVRLCITVQFYLAYKTTKRKMFVTLLS